MAQKVNLSVDQGTTFLASLIVTDVDTDEPLDISVYTATGQIRKFYTSSNSVNIECLAGETLGSLVLHMTPAVTGTLKAGRYVYDVELHEAIGNTTIRVIEGIVTVNPEVTK